jgi:hypothetical protein
MSLVRDIGKEFMSLSSAWLFYPLSVRRAS